MSKRSSKICLISPTENLASRAKTLIARRKMDVRVEVAALEGAVSLAQSLLEQDDYLFISRRATREMLIKCLGAQVVNIPLEASDYIPVIQRLQNERGLIASFSYEEEISNDLGTICYLLNLNVQNYYFTDSSNCQAAVQQAVADGAVCGFGGVVAQHFAGLCNLPFFMVESSDASILWSGTRIFWTTPTMPSLPSTRPAGSLPPIRLRTRCSAPPSPPSRAAQSKRCWPTPV